MTQLDADVSIPLISKGKLIGMINLGRRSEHEIYSHEDIELLSMLANQAAIAVENARLYEDLKRSKSYIRRADRLASLGTLTAGLAHEIRNPLVAIKTLTQLLPDRLEDEEFRNHFPRSPPARWTGFRLWSMNFSSLRDPPNPNSKWKISMPYSKGCFF
jgi:GAF domain-containing protein